MDAYGVCRGRIAGAAKGFVMEGMEAALGRKTQQNRARTTRIYPQIGHIKRKELRADHLNTLYSLLAQPGQNKRTGGGLSPKSITEHHRLISTVLDQAEKEGLVPFNVAGKATLPDMKKKEVNYFQPEQVTASLGIQSRGPQITFTLA